MTMKEFAENEVRIAKEKGVDDYVAGCIDSAMEALNTLFDKGHSGMSMGMTRMIFNRLVKGYPLTKINDSEDVWVKVHTNADGEDMYQCNRCSSLFKHVKANGETSYSSTERTVAIDENGDSYGYSEVEKFINSMHPIAFPYSPDLEPFRVYIKKESNQILCYTEPNGKIHIGPFDLDSQEKQSL